MILAWSQRITRRLLWWKWTVAVDLILAKPYFFERIQFILDGDTTSIADTQNTDPFVESLQIS